MAAKVYTKTGDKGSTSLLGGKKVPKSSLRIEAYGTVDELNAFVGYLHDQPEASNQVKEQLQWVQNQLFTLGSLLAVAPDFKGFELPQIYESDIKQLEDWIDEMETTLPELRNFILPSGHKTVSLCHVCRTVCRRAERGMTALSKQDTIGEHLLPFVNRLSDFFFVLSRKFSHDLKVAETIWTPRKG